MSIIWTLRQQQALDSAMANKSRSQLVLARLDARAPLLYSNGQRSKSGLFWHLERPRLRLRKPGLVHASRSPEGRSAIYDHAMQASRAILTKYKEVRRKAGIPSVSAWRYFPRGTCLPGQAVQAAEAVRLIHQGGTPSEIGARLRQLVEQTHTYLVPGRTLPHLQASVEERRQEHRLGRIHWVRCSTKPILHCHQDVTGPVDKVTRF